VFKNLRLLRLPNGITAEPGALAEQLAKRAFQPCGANDRFSHGWVDPHIDTGLVYSMGNQRLLCFQSEDKILPSSYVRRCAQAKAEQIEEAQGYKPGRKQMREIMEQVEAELLPRAFTKLSRSFVWIDNSRGWFVVDGSASRADDVIELLKQSMDMLPQMAIPATRNFAGAAMTAWLAAGEAPGRLSIDRDCELRAKTDEKAAVKYSHSNLDSEELAVAVDRQSARGGGVGERVPPLGAERSSRGPTSRVAPSAHNIDIAEPHGQPAGDPVPCLR
jgi:recombination associated protein RdgC